MAREETNQIREHRASGRSKRDRNVVPGSTVKVNPPDFAAICSRTMLGTRVARYFFGFTACVGTCALIAGCIVTDKIDFQEETNYPPSLVSAPSARNLGTSLDQIISAELTDNAPDAGASELVIPVIVRDPNSTQALAWQLYIDFRPDFATLPRFDGTIEPSGVGVERPREFRVPIRSFGTAGCHKIEILISSGFGTGRQVREPVIPGDLGVGVWWLRLTDASHPSVDMSSCP